MRPARYAPIVCAILSCAMTLADQGVNPLSSVVSRRLNKRPSVSRKVHPALLPRNQQAGYIRSTIDAKHRLHQEKKVYHRPDDTKYLPKEDEVLEVTHSDQICSHNTISAVLHFNAPFKGIIYSKGFYDDPMCRYFSRDKTHQNQWNITVPFKRCGTKIHQGDHQDEHVVENTIVIQKNNKVLVSVSCSDGLGGSDMVFKLSCVHGTDDDSTVESSLSVDTVDVVSVSLKDDGNESQVDCYLDIQTGRGPFSQAVNGFVTLGDAISLVISASGNVNDLHIQVRECIGHDGDPSNAIQLTNEDGRVIRSKLIGQWQTNSQDIDSDTGEIITWAYAKAFKFPERSQLFIECDVDICKGDCAVAASKAAEEHDDNVHSDITTIRVRRGISVQGLEDTQNTQTKPPPAVNNFLNHQLQAKSKIIKEGLCLSSPFIIPVGGIFFIILIIVILICVYLSIKLKTTVSEQEEKLRPSPASSIIERDFSLPARPTLRDGPSSGRYQYPMSLPAQRVTSRERFY